jgi:hypothetical protein
MGKLLRGEPISLAFVGGSITWCACMHVGCAAFKMQVPQPAESFVVVAAACLANTPHDPYACIPQIAPETAAPASPAAHRPLLQGPGADQVGQTDYAALVLAWINATFPHPGHHLSNGGIPAAPSRCAVLLLAS